MRTISATMNTRGALRCAECASNASRRSFQIQQRGFANSLARYRYGAVPAFSEPSSPELAAILHSLRQHYMIPPHLSKEQRSLLYTEKGKKLLEGGEVVARIAGEEIPLQHLRSIRSPNAKKSLHQALDLFKTTEDWNNLPKLLKGIKRSRVNYDKYLGLIVRKAGMAGKQGVIHECARAGSSAGFDLSNVEVVQQILFWNHMLALQNDFDFLSTEKALSLSEGLFELMELDCHHAAPGQPDPQNDPNTVGYLLELAAVKAAFRKGENKDTDGKVQKYAAKMLVACSNGGISAAPTSKNDASVWIGSKVPILFGMKTALEILDPTTITARELSGQAEKLEADISAQVEACKAQSNAEDAASGEKKLPMGLTSYNKLIVDRKAIFSKA